MSHKRRAKGTKKAHGELCGVEDGFDGGLVVLLNLDVPLLHSLAQFLQPQYRHMEHGGQDNNRRDLHGDQTVVPQDVSKALYLLFREAVLVDHLHLLGEGRLASITSTYNGQIRPAIV